MADVLTSIVKGTKQGVSEVASNVLESLYGAGLFGSILENIVSEFNPPKEEKQRKETSDDFSSIAATVVSLEKYFVQISDNIYNIASAIGAQVSSMEEIQQILADNEIVAIRAQEEAATEKRRDENDATPISIEGNNQERAQKDRKQPTGPLGSLIATFKNNTLEVAILEIGKSIAKSILSFGSRLIALMNPAGIALAIVAAVGYGVFEYFTNDEFKTAIDDGVKGLWDTAKEAASSIVEMMERFVTGTFEVVGGIWDTIKNWAEGVWNGLKKGAGNIARMIGIGGKESAEPVAAVPVAKATTSPVATPSSTASSQQATTPSIPAPTASLPPTAAPVSVNQPQMAASDARQQYAEPVRSTRRYQPTTAATAIDFAYQQAMPAPIPADNSGWQQPTSIGAPVAQPIEVGTEQQIAGPIEQVISKADSSVNLSGLVAAFKARVFGLANDYQQMTGKKLTVTSAYRSPEKQRELYARDPAHAAPPGRSPHEVGTAIDINSPDAIKAEQLGLLQKYSLFRPLAFRPQNPEPWHVEPVERKALATIGDGLAVPSQSGSAVSPGTGKPVPVPPSPSIGANIAKASQEYEQIFENRQKFSTTNIFVNNSRTTTSTFNVGVLQSSPPCEPRSQYALGT